jgi:peroxiredoxin
MSRIAAALLVATGMALVAPAHAGEFNKKLKIGDAAPTFSNLEGVDGKTHSLSDYKKDVVVVVVTCNHCPVAVGYQDRIIAFTKKYGDKVDVVAINVNNIDQDKLDKMKERAKEAGFNFPYLYDASQKVGREYGATVTPEFFVLDKERKIAYMGAMDDSNNAAKVKVNYLDPAVDATLKGEKPAKAESAARGCGIKYEKNGN